MTIKAQKGTQSTVDWSHPSFIHHQTPDRRGIASFNCYLNLPYSPIWFPLISHPSSISTLLQDFSALLHTIYYMFLSPPRPLVVKPSVLQLQQFGIPSHSVSSNHHLLAPSNVISKLIYLPSLASPFSHPATPVPPTRACLNLCTI